MDSVEARLEHQEVEKGSKVGYQELCVVACLLEVHRERLTLGDVHPPLREAIWDEVEAGEILQSFEEGLHVARSLDIEEGQYRGHL